MNVRFNSPFAIVFAAAVPFLTVGCGAPEAEFSFSESTRSLIPEARAPVQDAVLENFGTPQDIVAWLRLPIAYGGFQGEVVEASEPHSDRFRVRLESETEDVEELTHDDLSGMGLLWQSGKYVGVPLDFQVSSYDPSEGELAINAELADPLESGERFVLVGNVLQDGRRLYMQHCMHCHGVSGDGEGPTAAYLEPLPRDYRRGLFKFTSTTQTDRASRDDLVRIIKEGIPGTYMPSFWLLDEDEMTAIVEYVRWLAMRGEFERSLAEDLARDYSISAVEQRIQREETRESILEELEEDLEFEFPERIDAVAGGLERNWERAEEEESVVFPQKARPPADAESLARGRELYLSRKAQCWACHGTAALGDGPQTEDFHERPGGDGRYPRPGLHDEWGNLIQPRDLRRGIYRGGRRPIDLYRRIYAGIKGTPMPPLSTALDEDEIWDIVNYVMSLPYERETPGASPDERVASQPEPDPGS